MAGQGCRFLQCKLPWLSTEEIRAVTAKICGTCCLFVSGHAPVEDSLYEDMSDSMTVLARGPSIQAPIEEQRQVHKK